MKAESPTLVILTPGFPANEADDTCLPERQVFVKSLKAQYPSLHIVVLSFHYPYLAQEYNWFGVTVISFAGKNRGNANRLIIWYQIWQTLKRLHKETKIIGLLHFWLGECAFVGNYFAKKYHIKHYSWLLGQDAKKSNKYAKWTKPKAETLIALSDFLADEFFRNYSIKPQHIIPPGIDVNEFSQQPFERKIDVLGVGSLIPLKQYDLFIDLIKSLSDDIPHINAVICGKGSEKPKLLQQIQSLGLENTITLLGEVSHKKVVQLMQQAKVLLHPSTYEGWSTVCMEALYAGASVVAFCQPMKTPIEKMYIVSSKEEMLATVAAVLKEDKRVHEPVLPYTINETVEKIVQLYLQ